ncbi:MAG TPA: gamma-glutamylcyclotransferase [Stellaceae bacterium]|nr:gamma-glutamylcyclotransferase [Stellaceae bacterium]
MPADPPSGDKNCTHKLTRESVLSGEMRRLIEQRDPSVRVISDEEHCAAVAEILDRRPDGSGDVWLFAYGSLIWNPMIHFVDRRVATVHGFHRRFCLWTHLGRGSAERPGLILGLDRGGTCRGLAYRIEASKAPAELELLWRREMITGSYCPRWMRIVTAEGGPGWAIAFLINRSHPRYAGLVPEDRIVESIARAHGALGPCATYLFDTARHLQALGIRDTRLFRLRDRVAQVLERHKKSPE